MADGSLVGIQKAWTFCGPSCGISTWQPSPCGLACWPGIQHFNGKSPSSNAEPPHLKLTCLGADPVNEGTRALGSQLVASRDIGFISASLSEQR